MSSASDQHLAEEELSVQNFKRTHTFEVRRQQYGCARSLHPQDIPVICERSPHASALTPARSVVKYLVPVESTVLSFLKLLRGRLNVPPSLSLFLFVGGVCLTGGAKMADIAAKYRDDDGFLYMEYCCEETLG